MEQAAALRAMNTYRDNDTSAQPQSERITIQGSRKSIAFVGKESNRLISDVECYTLSTVDKRTKFWYNKKQKGVKQMSKYYNKQFKE